MTAPDALRSLRRALNHHDPPHQPDPAMLARQRQALATRYRRRTPPPGFGGDWWALWWTRQKRRHRIHLTIALVAGIALGRLRR